MVDDADPRRRQRKRPGLRAGGNLEMTTLSQSLRDRILWILANHDGIMERSRLRRHMGMRYAILNPILDELAREGRIKMTVGKHEDLISLINR
jgi:predicted transcriptional regulator